MKRFFMFTFSSESVTEPVIHSLGTLFNIEINVRRASIQDDGGWALVELDGEEGRVGEAIDWVIGKGVRVEPAPGSEERALAP